MPGQEHDAQPGKQPGKPKVLFTEEQERTTAPAPKPQRPKVLFSTDQQQTTVPSVQPEPPRPAILFNAARQPPTPKSKAPRVLLNGVRRQRVVCTIEDLQLINPQASPQTLRAALKIIEGTNLDDDRFDDIVTFGESAQAEHADLTKHGLALAHHPDLLQGNAALAQVLHLLEQLDPQVVLARLSSPFQAVRSWLNPKGSATSTFDQLYPKLELAARGLQSLQPSLDQILDQLVSLNSRYLRLSQDIQSQILACGFLASYARSQAPHQADPSHYAAQADTLDQKLARLIESQVTAETGRQANAILQSGIQALFEAASELMTQDLPVFRTAYLAALAATTQTKPVAATNTELQAVRDVHVRMMAKVKGE